MPKIVAVYECPHCNAPLTSGKRPETCPECKYNFGEAAMDFKLPVMLSEQNVRLQNKTAYLDTIIDLPIEKANFILNDALNIVQTVPIKNVRVSDIRELMQMAIAIGQIATKYQEYLEAGGKHGPSLFFKEETQDGSSRSGKGTG